MLAEAEDFAHFSGGDFRNAGEVESEEVHAREA
jgi:hypothetical protein